MIYLQHTTDAQAAYIPRDTEITGTLRLVLRSTVNLETVFEATVLDLKTMPRYYFVSVRLPEGCPSGEYEYKLTAGDLAVSTGCARVTDPATVNEYNKAIQYEQYEQ